MNKVIKRFGEIVGNNIETHPDRSLKLLKAGYTVNGLQLKYLPDSSLLPDQKYSSAVCNKKILYSLSNPDKSAVVNVFFPCELLHAMDITPAFVEGLSCYLNGVGSERYFIDYAENMGIPKTYCSYHKVLLGAAFSKVIPKPRFIMNTTMVCDANIITFRALADFWEVPAFTVDVPGSFSEEAVSYVEEQLRKAVVFIENITGQKFNYDKLKEIIRRENASTKLYREYYKELAHKDILNDVTSEMYKLFFTHILNGTKEAEKYFELLLSDARCAKPAGDKTRILWCHTIPNWQESVRKFFNQNKNYQLLCTDVNNDGVVDLDETNPFRSLAVKMLQNHIGGSANRRADKLLQMAKDLNADGVVYFNHWGCKKTLGSSGLVKQMLEDSGIPVLVLDGDGCDRGNINEGQMETRLQAFLEILGGKS